MHEGEYVQKASAQAQASGINLMSGSGSIGGSIGRPPSVVDPQLCRSIEQLLSEEKALTDLVFDRINNLRIKMQPFCRGEETSPRPNDSKGLTAGSGMGNVILSNVYALQSMVNQLTEMADRIDL